MSKHKLIPYPVIAAAVRGDPEAVNQVLDHYSGYIAALSMRRGYDQNGNPCLAVDEAIRRHQQSRREAAATLEQKGKRTKAKRGHRNNG